MLFIIRNRITQKQIWLFNYFLLGVESRSWRIYIVYLKQNIIHIYDIYP